MASLVMSPIIGSSEPDEVIVRGVCEVPTLGGNRVLNGLATFVVHADNDVPLKNDYALTLRRETDGEFIKVIYGYTGSFFSRDGANLGNFPWNRVVKFALFKRDIRGEVSLVETGTLESPCPSFFN